MKEFASANTLKPTLARWCNRIGWRLINIGYALNGDGILIDESEHDLICRVTGRVSETRPQDGRGVCDGSTNSTKR